MHGTKNGLEQNDVTNGNSCSGLYPAHVSVIVKQACIHMHTRKKQSKVDLLKNHLNTQPKETLNISFHWTGLKWCKPMSSTCKAVKHGQTTVKWHAKYFTTKKTNPTATDSSNRTLMWYASTSLQLVMVLHAAPAWMILGTTCFPWSDCAYIWWVGGGQVHGRTCS